MQARSASGISRKRSTIGLSLLAALLACLWLVTCCAVEAHAESRVALIIGNSAYRNAPALKTPAADASALAKIFGQLGFSVTKLDDASYDDLRRALLAFGRTAREADIGVIIFAGYGMEMQGENWLVPIDAQLKTDLDVEDEAINLRSAMTAVSGARKVGIVILDACRDNPFLAKMQVAKPQRGLARIDGLALVEPSDNNILVAYAAKPGTTAVSGEGEHSPFTAALLKDVEMPGLEIGFLFRNVRDDVLDDTDNAQEPATYGSLSDEAIVLKPDAEVAAAAVPAPPQPERNTQATAGMPSADEIAWSFLRDSPDRHILQGFLHEFPMSPYVKEAQVRLASLEQAPGEPSSDELSWSFVRETRKPDVLQRYIQQYPASPRIAEARLRLASLERSTGQNPVSADDDELQAVQRKLPPRPHAVARRFKRNTAEVEQAWGFIKDTTDTYVLRRFVAEFPDEQYIKTAKARIAGLGEDWRPDLRPHLAGDSDYYVHTCDLLASDPNDPSRPSGVSGVVLNRLDAASATTACKQAVDLHPEIPRLQYQLCRCFLKLQRPEDATVHCDAAARAGANAAGLYNTVAIAVRPFADTGNPGFNKLVPQVKKHDALSGVGGGTFGKKVNALGSHHFRSGHTPKVSLRTPHVKVRVSVRAPTVRTPPTVRVPTVRVPTVKVP